MKNAVIVLTFIAIACVGLSIAFLNHVKFNSLATDVDALMDAAGTGDLDAVKYYVENGGDITRKDDAGRTAVWYAIFWGQKDVFLYLSKHEDFTKIINDPDTIFGTTPLEAATQQFDSDFVTILLHHGADPFPQNKSGETLLDICKDLVTTGCRHYEKLVQDEQ